jgi:hypothetical protein
MIKRTFVRKDDKLTPEQERMLDELANRPEEADVADEDCPDLSPAMIKAFECLIRQSKRDKLSLCQKCVK